MHDSYTVKEEFPSAKRSFHHHQDDRRTQSTCFARFEENYACTRPSFPGGGNREEKSGSCIRSPLSKGYAIPILSTLETSSRGLRVVPWLYFLFFFSFQPCVTRLSSPFNSTRETRIICGRDPLERNKEHDSVVLSTRWPRIFNYASPWFTSGRRPHRIKETAGYVG